MESLTLKPLHLPPAPGWWPPAPGWWLLSVICLVLVAVAVGYCHLWRKRRQQQQWLQQQLAAATHQTDACNALHRLLRRTLCHWHPPLRTADHAHWQQALESIAAGTHINDLLQFETQRYQPGSSIDPDVLGQQVGFILQRILQHPKRCRRQLTRQEALHE